MPGRPRRSTRRCCAGVWPRRSSALAFEVTGDGTGNVAGIPEGVLRHYSKHRVAIEKHMRGHGTSGAKAAQVATLATRKAKEHGVSELELSMRWRQEADELGFDPASVPRWLGEPLPASPPTRRWRV